MDEKHNISLGAIDVGIFQQKDFVYTIFLKNGELDKETNWTSQVSADYQVFLPSDLSIAVSCGWFTKTTSLRIAYIFKQR